MNTLFALALALKVGAAVTASESGSRSASVSNGSLRVEAEISDGNLHERYLALRDGEWVLVGTSGSSAVDLIGENGATAAVRPQQVVATGTVLTENFLVGDTPLTRTVRLSSAGPWLHVSTVLEPRSAMHLHALMDRFEFPRRADWSYAPSVGGFIPDAQYKAPVVLVQSGRVALGIVPDLATLDRAALQRCAHVLDLDARAMPQLAVGFMPARMSYHSVFAADPQPTWTAGEPVTNAYYLLVTATAEPAAAYREVVRLHWRKFGRPLQRLAAAQQRGTPTPLPLYDWIASKRPVPQQIETDRKFPSLTLWDDWRKLVWHEQTQQNWLELPLPGGAVGGGVWTHRWGPGPSIYLSAWFNTLRTSFGLALHARRLGDDRLLRLAAQTVELALHAPGVDGAFKCVAAWDESAHRIAWAAGDGRGGGVKTGFLGYDMSWTGYWLLRWRAAGLPDSETILPRCRALAEFFAARQQADGLLPTRFAEDGSVLSEQSRQVKAETGPVALFLLELYAQDPDPRWRQAALNGLRFLDESVVPQRQWYDYETFWSCSPREPKFDARSGQWPANDLALGQSVAAYLTAYRATRDRAYLERGERLLDYLLLYQQCWTNPRLEDLTGPAMLLGGFTTQNSDAEWSDALQSQFGNVLLDYYRATGNPEYLERGVAALRAQFPVSPSENWAHSGVGGKSGISSFHWGTGSGLAGVEIEEDFLRDGVVDIATSTGVGVNGLNITKCDVADGTIRLEIDSPFTWSHPPVLIFHHADGRHAYRVVVNGSELGTFRGDELAHGLPAPLSANR